MQRRCSRLDTDHFWGLLIHTHFIFSFYLTCNHIIMTASSYSLSLVPLACYPPGPGMVSGMGLLTLTATVIDSLALYILPDRGQYRRSVYEESPDQSPA